MSDKIPGTDIPKPEVELSGSDGNAGVVIGKVRLGLKRALRAGGQSAAEIKDLLGAFSAEATSDDYNHVLETCHDWVEVT